MHSVNWVYEQSASPIPWAIMLEAVGAGPVSGIVVDVLIYHENLKDGVIALFGIRCNDSRFLAAYIEHLLRKEGLTFTQADYHSIYMTVKVLFHEQGACDNDR